MPINEKPIDLLFLVKLITNYSVFDHNIQRYKHCPYILVDNIERSFCSLLQMLTPNKDENLMAFFTAMPMQSYYMQVRKRMK